MDSKKSVVRFALTALLVVGVLESGLSLGKPETQSGQGASAPVQTEQAYEQVTINNGGRLLTFTEMPRRVVAFNSYVTENMLALGLADKIAATSAMSPGNKPLAEFAAEYANIPEIPQRSHEIALSYDPQLVAGQVSTFTDRAWGTVEMFQDKGIQSYIIAGTLVEDETIDHIYEDLENLGKIFKVEDRAIALIAAMKAKVDRVRKVTAGLTKKPKVFVMDSNNGNEIYTTSKGLESQLIELAGGVNVTRNESPARWFTTSIETLVDKDPDIILFNVYGTVPVEEKIAFIDENPALKDVAAVKNRHYVIIPLQDVMQDIRAADTVQTLAKAFYPDLFN
ncbi:MAG: ABC transporter substrate-binding protein [Treponema sp.]|jgi:iron complex transport system substrate-binding protein|nr:ABC transporter substrate-binding protein [Treponema sp.]